MKFASRTMAVAIALLLLLFVTAAVRRVAPHTEHIVFFYLLPAAFVVTFYGSIEALIFACGALACSAFFFYDPVHSFYVSDPRAVGELICFAGLVTIGAKCATELRLALKKRQTSS